MFIERFLTLARICLSIRFREVDKTTFVAEAVIREIKFRGGVFSSEQLESSRTVISHKGLMASTALERQFEAGAMLSGLPRMYE